MEQIARGRTILRFKLGGALLWLCCAVFPAPAGAFEKPGMLKADEYLAPEIRTGQYHTVEEAIENDGFLNHYRVQSAFGSFSAVSDTALYRLIHELQAIAAMRRVKTEDVAVASLQQSGENTIAGIRNLFNDPEKTLEGAASGVQSLFSRASETIGRRELTGAEDSRFEQVVGLTKSKGTIAVSYGVSIYSRNHVLQQELERLAQADYLGGLSVGLATSAVPGVGGVVLTASGTTRLLNEVVNTTPASELWLQNKNKLMAMGIDGDTSELFLNNQVFDPELETVFVVALEKMQEVKNRELAVKVALQAHDTVMARVITETVALLAWYNERKEPLAALRLLGRLMCGMRQNGVPAVVLPVDYMTWNEGVAGLARELSREYPGAAAPPQLILTGRLSDAAGREFKSLGWSVQERVRDEVKQAIR